MMQNETPEVHSQVVKAGKRTYFFDVKATKSQDFYITITESKKVFSDGKESFQKHKLFLYKEDFEKFIETLGEVIEKTASLNASKEEVNDENTSYASDLSFEDL